VTTGALDVYLSAKRRQELPMGTTVVMDDVMEALELAADEMSSYVNSRTGEVITLTHDDLRLAEEDSAPEMPDWQQEILVQAKQVLASEEWLQLPSKFDIHEWAIMDRFAASLSNESARAELLAGIRRTGAFRNFKYAIRKLGVEDQWFAYKQRALEELAREWLARHGLSPSMKAAQPSVADAPDHSANK
jgi:hypothetical protein